MSNRSISVAGHVAGILNSGDNNNINSNHENSSAIRIYLSTMFEDLNVQFPDADDNFKIECVKQKITSDIKNKKPISLALKDALLNGAQELTGILSDNPFVRLSMALLRGWIQ